MNTSLRVFLSTVALTCSLAANAYAYGAIAVDDAEGLAAGDVGYGVSVGWDNRDDAKSAALRECKKGGNRNCEVAVWFETCGAYAVSHSTKGIGYGATIAAAKKMALNQCGGGCRVVVSECE